MRSARTTADRCVSGEKNRLIHLDVTVLAHFAIIVYASRPKKMSCTARSNVTPANLGSSGSICSYATGSMSCDTVCVGLDPPEHKVAERNVATERSVSVTWHASRQTYPVVLSPYASGMSETQ